jgi:very-short-patch-repair endonuclease
MRTQGDNPRPDQQVAHLASRQHGVVTRPQLLDAGLLSSGIAVRLETGRLHRIHRGVYAVGHSSLGNGGRWMAAVLACGEGAVLSHRSAAELWGIRRGDRRRSEAGGRGESALIDVTVPRTSGMKKRTGIALHRSKTLKASDCTRFKAIPVTRPVRTLTDLRKVVPADEFAAALRQAEFLRLPIGHELPSEGTRSELESRMLALCRRHRLPEPKVNVRVDRYTVDFLWREQRLIVELDGWESHRGRAAFEDDRLRDARLKLLGFEVLRFTWRQVASGPREVVATIRALLERSR